MMPRTALFVALVCLAGLAAAVPPTPWPPVHTHVEIEFTLSDPGAEQIKQFYYDYSTLSMRVDGTYLAGPSILKLIGFSSYWLNDTLSIETTIDSVPTCTVLPMGFGMPVPNWFAFGATTVEDGLWLTRQYNRSEPWYFRTQWNRKSAMPDGYFNYFSFNDTGAPFRMSAPSPAGEVLNEYYSFVPVTSFPAGTFTVPASCASSQAVRRHVKPSDVATLSSFGDMLSAVLRQQLLPDAAVAVAVRHASQLVLMAKA